MQIKDINAVVTGGASGLGLATATRLIESGATVTLLDLPGSAGVEQAEALGPAARFVPTDVTDPTRWPPLSPPPPSAARSARSYTAPAGASRCASSPRRARPPPSNRSSR